MSGAKWSKTEKKKLVLAHPQNCLHNEQRGRFSQNCGSCQSPFQVTATTTKASLRAREQQKRKMIEFLPFLEPDKFPLLLFTPE
jgi:hypothetical protein